MEALEEKHILRYLLVLVSLVKKYGHKLDISDVYLKLISQNNPEIIKLYQFLHTLGKTNSRDLQDIVKICKKVYAHYRKEFSISADASTHQSLTTFITKTFDDADLAFSDVPSVPGLDLKGEWYRYHRTLDKDLDTILGS